MRSLSKNKDLYGEIIRILSDSNGMKFGELNRELDVLQEALD